MKCRLWILIGGVILFVVCFGIACWIVSGRLQPLTLSPLSTVPFKEKPLEQYTIEHLAGRVHTKSPIVFGEPVSTASSYTVLPFSFYTDTPISSDRTGLRRVKKKVTGLAHVPAGRQASKFFERTDHKFPVVIQVRGYADRDKYAPGVGTKHSAEVFAANGFVSLAPDFLGYGGSDKGSEHVFEDRFQTYTTVLDLIASVPTLSFVDPDRVFLWGHSNGGQIALTVLTVLGEKGKVYPTSLWAPVTKKFPYSILFYTDEFEDYGKALRKELANFEKEYDADRYAFPNYLERIQAPIILHQGAGDEEVPEYWSREFTEAMKEKGKSIRYYTYPGADHNFSTSWDAVISRDVDFFSSFLP